MSSQANSPRSASLRSGANPLLGQMDNPEDLLRTAQPLGSLTEQVNTTHGDTATLSTGGPAATSVQPAAVPVTAQPMEPRGEGPSTQTQLQTVAGLDPRRVDRELKPLVTTWIRQAMKSTLTTMVEEVLDQTIPSHLPDLISRCTGDLIETWVSPDVEENAFKTTLRLMTLESVRKELDKTYNPIQPIQVLNAQPQHFPIPTHDLATIGLDGAALPDGTQGPRAFNDNNQHEENTTDENHDNNTTKKHKKSRRGKKKKKNRSEDDSYHSESSSNEDRNGDSSSDDDRSRHRYKSSKSALKVIRPLNDLFTKAVDYRTYRLDKKSTRSDTSPKAIRDAKKRINTQLLRTTFAGTDPIAILGFLTQFRNACNHNGVSEAKAMCLFQYYLTVRALHLLHSRMNVNSMAVDEDHDESISSYPEVGNFLLQTYATNEVIATAYADLTAFIQASGQTETEFGDKLWDKAIRCGAVISKQRLRSMYAEGLLPGIRAQVRNHLANHPKLTYDELNRYAQALGDSMRAARKPSTVGFRLGDITKPKPKRAVMSIDTESVTSLESGGYSDDQ